MTLDKVTQNNQPVPVQILARLNLDGQGIPVGAAFKDSGVELDSGRLWSKHPEKSLGMRADWVEQNPNAAKAPLQRWGKLEAGADLEAVIGKVSGEDLWREAAKELGVAAAEVPSSTSRGPETFFDGKVFDFSTPEAYLASLGIERVA
jgi:ABC-type nitrate/sulfonate/bicarbonate transport system substrate-binding protein